MNSSQVETKSDTLTQWAWGLGMLSVLSAIAGLCNHMLLFLRVNDIFGNAQAYHHLTASWSIINWLSQPMHAFFFNMGWYALNAPTAPSGDRIRFIYSPHDRDIALPRPFHRLA